MSSFGRYCEVARDAAEPVGRRYKSLRYAAERYSWLTHTSFESVFDELRSRCGLKVGVINSDGVLIAAATELENARHAFLAQLNTLVAERKLEKHSGRRSPRAGWTGDLAAAVTLGRPLAQRQESPVIKEVLAEVARVATPPEFAIGVLVEVILNARNRTPRRGLTLLAENFSVEQVS
jgi:hypothetical protein